MKMVTKIVLGLLSLVAILLIVALFVKKEYSIQREIVINRSKEQVFDYLKHLKNQDYYSKWVMTDPNMKKTFRGSDGTVGFVYAWDGNDKAGKGEQEIKNLTEGEMLDIEVRFEKPMKTTARTPFYMEAVSGNATRVRWGMVGKSSYPMNLMNPFMDNLLGKDIETSLHNLKKILENQ